MTKARDIATSEVVTGEIGSTIQAHDDDLDSIAALDKTDGNVIVGDGANWVSESGATARTSLGLGTAATTASTDYATAAQGTKADSALQPTGDGSGLTGIAGGFSNMQVFTAPGTWTNPGNVQKVKVTVVGGGGGGGTTAQANSASAGGGGGGTAIEVISFPSGTNVPITRGGGGGAGSSGGTSSFGGYCSASGGAGGSPTPSTTTNGGGGGSGSGGALNIIGADGDSGGWGGVYGGPGVQGGSGGPSHLGGGGRGGGVGSQLNANPIPGAAGNNYGGGGGGGRQRDGGTATGGAGAAGVIIVEY